MGNEARIAFYEKLAKQRERERIRARERYIPKPRGHRHRMARLPMQPLIRMLGWPDVSIKQCARNLGVDHAFFYRMIKDGVTTNLADKYACQGVGQHPAVIWGNAWWAALDYDHPRKEKP